jgi:hypothetical protein
MTRAATTGRADPHGPGARAELRSWYLDRLRPRLARAVAAGIVDRTALEQVDIELAGLLEPPGNLAGKARLTAR